MIFSTQSLAAFAASKLSYLPMLYFFRLNPIDTRHFPSLVLHTPLKPLVLSLRCLRERSHSTQVPSTNVNLSLMVSFISCFLQPQLVVLPPIRCILGTSTTFPQSHIHSQMIEPFEFLFSVIWVTTSLPNLFPCRSSLVLYSVFPLIQPQFVTIPRLSRFVDTLIFPPHVHLQSHLKYPFSFSGRRDNAVSIPNCCPVKSNGFVDKITPPKSVRFLANQQRTIISV